MSWRPEVQTAADGDAWTPNAMRFATKEESDQWAKDLSFRWTAVTDIRSVEVDDPVNYEIINDELRRL